MKGEKEREKERDREVLEANRGRNTPPEKGNKQKKDMAGYCFYLRPLIFIPTWISVPQPRDEQCVGGFAPNRSQRFWGASGSFPVSPRFFKRSARSSRNALYGAFGTVLSSSSHT